MDANAFCASRARMTMPGTEARSTRLLVWIPFGAVLFVIAAYLSLIRGQSDPHTPAPDPFTVPFIAGYLGIMAALLGVSLLERPWVVPLRPALRACPAAGLLVSGVLAIFSIGLPLLLSGALAAAAAVRTLGARPGWRVVVIEATAAVLAVILLIAGLEVTERLIVCPASGSSGGGGPGFITGGYHWECVNGQLHMHSGFCNSSSGSTDSNGNVTTTCP
jgi:hypothetical protein